MGSEKCYCAESKSVLYRCSCTLDTSLKGFLFVRFSFDVTLLFIIVFKNSYHIISEEKTDWQRTVFLCQPQLIVGVSRRYFSIFES